MEPEPEEAEPDWRWSGLEKKMKWIGLEWRKGGEIGEKSCSKLTFSRKHIKHNFKKQIRPFSGKKSPAGIPLGNR